MNFVGASRFGSLELRGQELSVAVQMRGAAWVDAREGRFCLRAGEWIVLPRDSRPLVHAQERGMCILLTVSDDAIREMARFGDFHLHAGRGQLKRAEALAFARLWRRARQACQGGRALQMEPALRSLLLLTEGLQSDYAGRIAQCPGQSLVRRRQIFERMQRAYLYMQGNCHRVVRVGELAELAKFSSWYFSRIFHKLYGQTPQAMSAVIRLAHAAELLVSTPLSIGEIGAESGFENNCSFSRSFRANFGVTASEYRNAARYEARFRQARPQAGALAFSRASAPVRSMGETRRPHLRQSVAIG